MRRRTRVGHLELYKCACSTHDIILKESPAVLCKLVFLRALSLLALRRKASAARAHVDSKRLRIRTVHLVSKRRQACAGWLACVVGPVPGYVALLPAATPSSQPIRFD